MALSMANKAKSKKNAVVKKEVKSPYSPTQIKKFINEVKVEFTKIVWPEKKVTFGLTGIVVLLTAVISIYLGGVDMLLGKLVSFLLR